MWIILTLTCALSQALWMALSKRRLQTLTPVQFMLFLRVPIVVVFVPAFLLCPRPTVTGKFWLVAVLTAVTECVRLVSFGYGTRRDYYATYSLLNMSPLFVLLLAPSMVGERITPTVVAGVTCVVPGGFLFYHAGRFQLAGLIAAASQGVTTTLCKLGLSLSSPIYFIFVLYGLSTAMLWAIEGTQSGFGPTARLYVASTKRTLPLSLLNLVAILSFMFGLNLAPATHFAVVFRTSLVFGFVLSLVMLKEYTAWKWKLAGGTFILIGSALIALKAAH